MLPRLAAVLSLSAGLIIAPVSAAHASDSQTVSYRGLAIDVPADWRVIDLDADPSQCVRFDEKTAYIGQIGTAPDCPARAVGITDTVWLHPSDETTDRPAQLSSDERTLADAHHVGVDATEADGSPAVPNALSTLRETSAATTEPPAAQPAPAQPRTTYSATSHASSVSTAAGMGFDACSAPAASTMNAWLQSPYRTVGIYIGGINRACSQPNLTASWVSQVRALGWGMIPTYVGLQAPCYTHGGSTITASTATQQGQAAADDAATQADTLQLGGSSPIYFDMEAYPAGNSSCTTAVLAFLSAWTNRLHSRGYHAGAYGSMASLMTDLSNNYNNSGYTRLDDVWFGHYNGLQSPYDSASFPAFNDSYWPNRRLHQYLGGHTQSWGGVAINIDEDWLAGEVSGTAVPVNYGANTFGPGSSGNRFVFTGDMTYWHADSTQGAEGMSYWTNSSGSTESNGATWTPSLKSGLYDISANITHTTNPGKAPYTIRAVEGTISRTIDQSTASGFTSLGQFRTLASTPFVVHMGDNDPSSTSKTLSVDAMRFTFLAGYPGQPTGVTGVPGDGNATVSWTAPDDGGSSLTQYTITANTGASITVDGSQTSALFPGLTNDSTYTFTVMATNAVGNGPVSSATAPVTPRAGAGTYFAMSPQRVLDTSKSQGGATLTSGAPEHVQIAGYGGVPFSGVTSVVLAVQTLNETQDSYLSITPSTPSSTSQVNFAKGQQTGGLVQATLDRTGSVLMRVGAGRTDVIFDVLGYYGSDSGGSKQVSVNPARIFNTTSSHQPIQARHPRTVRVAGVGGVPSNASAVVLSAQVLNDTYAGNDYLSVTPSSPQAISQLNVTAGQHSSGLIITAVGNGGTVLTRIGNGSADVIFDVTGYFTTSGGSDVYHPLTPFRAYQTAGDQLVAGQVRTITVPKIPDGAHAVMLSLQALNGTTDSYLSITPSGPAAISELNYPAGSHVSGAAIVQLGSGGTLSLRVGAGSADVILDVAGYYGP